MNTTASALVVGEQGAELTIMPTVTTTAATGGRLGARAPALHRAYGYVERADGDDDAPLPVVMCNEGRQADGIDLRMSGGQLDRFRANPVLGYGHVYWGRMHLPIGRVADPRIDGTRMRGALVFDRGDPFAAEVERKMRNGFLSAVSIGFRVNGWQDDLPPGRDGGGIATDWELAELSVVPIPMDPAAVVESGRSDAPDWAAQLVALIRSGALELRTRPPDPSDHALPAAPPVLAGGAVISADERASLLAAFDLPKGYTS